MEQPPPSKRTKLDPRLISADENETLLPHPADRCLAGGSTPSSDQTSCSSLAADQEMSGNEIQEQRDQGKVTTVDLQPTVTGRPVSVSVVSEPVTYAPPFSVFSSVSTQFPTLAAESTTATDFVALTTVTAPSVQTHPLLPPSLESAQDYYNPTSTVVEGVKLQAPAQNPHVSVHPKNIVTQSRVGVSNYPTPTAVVTQQSHVTDARLQPAICQATCMSTSKHMPYSDSDPQITIESTKTSLASRGIMSCDLLPLPPSSEEALVKATVAQLHYATALQSQSVSNFQKSIPKKGVVPYSVKSYLPPPQYSMVTTQPNLITSSVALQISRHQPIPSPQLAQASSIDDHLTSSSPITSIVMKDDEAESNQCQMAIHTPEGITSCHKQLPTSLPIQSQNQTSSLKIENDSNKTTSAAERGELQAQFTTEEDPMISINKYEAGEAFREHRDDLLIAITDPLILANSFYSKRIISREILDEIKVNSLTDSKKSFILLDAIEARIKTNPVDFLTVLSVFGRDPHLCIFAEGVRNTYCKLHTNSSLSVQPSNLTAIQKLDMYLSNYYDMNCSKAPLDTKFPHLQNKAFITLAVIEKERISRADADEFTKGTLLGHADEILKKKKPIALEAVLEPPEGCQNMKCVFIEGAPGIGKSTFALELCRKRKQIKTMKDYSLVLLLRLREKRVQAIEKINDLFYHDDTDLVEAVTEEVVACQGNKILFVLDGFDELPDNLRRDSFIAKLIRGDYLPACTILVTSRPSATADLQLSSVNIDKHIEILGFTHECIEQYATSMLSDLDQSDHDVLEDFLKYISNNPAIHGMMYIPLNSAIVLEIYKFNRTSKRPIPRTLTQLYTELSLVLLRKYLVETGRPQAETLHDKFTLEDLSEDLIEQLKKLGKVAYEGAISKNITFETLPEGCSHLGFMNVSTNLYMGRKSIVSYSFLHLTLQEFLAAYYISLLDNVHQELLIIKSFDLMSRASYLTRASHLNVMLRFIAGLTEFKSVGWNLACKPMQAHDGAITFSYHSELYISCLSLFAQCLLEIQSEQKIRDACNTIINSKGKSLHNIMCSALADSEEGEVTVVFRIFLDTLFDYYAVGRCVAASGCKWCVDGSGGGLNKAVESLAYGLQSVGNVCGSISELNLSSDDLTHHSMASFSRFPTKILTNIRELNLSNNRLDKMALDCLADSLLRMSSLSILYLSNNPGGDCGMVKVFLSLLHINKICNLSIFGTTLGLSDIEALSQLIRSGSSLKKLKIGDKDTPCEATVKAVLSSSSLEEVELCGLDYTAVNASTFQLLERNRNLKHLEANDSVDGLQVAIPHLMNALHSNESLKTFGIARVLFPSNIIQNQKSLNLDSPLKSDNITMWQVLGMNNQCDFGGDRSIEAIVEMIKVNTTLEELELSTLKITRDQVLTLNDALQMNKTLRRVTVNPQVFEFDPRIRTDIGYSSIHRHLSSHMLST